DGVGALRDVGQNHLLQMLALAAMDCPKNFEAEEIRSKRAEILEKIKLLPSQGNNLDNVYRAQYEGYRKIKGVSPKSETETYFKIKLFIDDDHWRGIPIILESGKRMSEIKKDIVITLKDGNEFIFSIKPDSGTSQYVKEYEKLLLDCIAGDQTLFVSAREVEAMWMVIDPIIEAWQKNLVSLKKYKPKNGAIGIIGLGKMGAGISKRLNEKGWQVIGYNRTPGELLTVNSIKELVEKLPCPRVVWLMVKAGDAVDEMINQLTKLLKKGDIIIDGGNSFYKDSIRRHAELKKRGIGFLDVGVSGGPSGARNGPALMIGGDKKVFEKIELLFRDLALQSDSGQAKGYQFFEGAGAGHFVKMIHNGVEYGMMQAIGEGFNILKNSSYKLDLKKVTDIYNNGSVIESRLIGWLKKAFELHGEDLEKVSGSVAHTGEGEWTVQTAKELGLEAKIIEASFKFRVLSEKNPSYTGKIVSALREQFGGHKVEEK
ncbi:MAG: phosphogluconate dehydrogenase (NAD(+)-dependent, decarboxylating), partial [Patescibacteria group bacterium]